MQSEIQDATLEHFSERLTLGALSGIIPVRLVRDILAETERESARRRSLPAELMVYFVIAMSLLFEDEYGEVLRQLAEGAKGWPELYPTEPPPGLKPFELRAWEARQHVKIAQKSSIHKARVRLGVEPVSRLFEEVARPLAAEGHPGCWFRELRLVSFDGTTLDVYDSPENAEAFGYPGASRGSSAFPQVRLVTLVELGTHANIAAALDGVRVASEKALSRRLISALGPGMLHLADRNFFGYRFFCDVADTGAHILWRLKTGRDLELVRVLDDGSWLAHIYPSAQKKKQKKQARLVRIIDYHLPGIPGTEPAYRLITTLLDPQEAPARQLATLYHERWDHEGTFDELKSHLLSSRPILRSRSPDLVRQEIWGLLLAHYAVRALMYQAAEQALLDPDHLSFMHALRVIRRRLPAFVVFPPSEVAADHRRYARRISRSQGGVQPR